MAGRIERLTQDIVAAPLGDIIASVGAGVASAQQALDEASIQQTLAIYNEEGGETTEFLREIGYRPTFYTLPETVGEVTIALSLGNQADQSASSSAAAPVERPTTDSVSAISRRSLSQRVRPRLYGTPVDGGYKNRYDYSADIAAKLTFTIVPVPAPNGLDELRAVPGLGGLAVSEAVRLAGSFDLGVEVANGAGPALVEDAIINEQAPRPGEVVAAGTIVTVTVNESVA